MHRLTRLCAPVISHPEMLLCVQDAQDDMSDHESCPEHEEGAQEDAGPDDLKKVWLVYMLYLVTLCLPNFALQLMQQSCMLNQWELLSHIVVG